MHSRGADNDAGKTSTVQASKDNEIFEVENLMTLKQAYPSEYQRVQGAFKDSMIH